MATETAHIPPHSIEAERAVLGALLTGDSSVYDSISGIVGVSDFYRDAHRVIFEALTQIIRKNKRADLVLLTEELTRLGKLEEVGGIAYITSLANDANAAFNVEEHARIVAEKAQLRRLIDAGNKIVSMGYDSSEEPEDVINSAEQMVLSVSGQSKAKSSFAAIGDVVQSTIARINEIQSNTQGLTGLPSGFVDLDKLTNGLQPSDLILVAARPSMGKTAFVLNIAQHAALRSQKSVAFFSLEMSKEQLVGRVLALTSGVEGDKLRSGNLSPQDWAHVIDAAEKLSSAKLFIDDTPGLTIPEMRSKLRRLKVEQGVDLIIVDYIQLMQGRSSGNSDNRQQEISEISRNLKIIAREMNVPLLALSQLSRGVESRMDKRPILSDLRESGSLEQDADIVMFLYRDKYYDENSEMGDLTELIVRKHRNGPLGTIQLQFDGALTKFRNVAFRDDSEEGM